MSKTNAVEGKVRYFELRERKLAGEESRAERMWKLYRKLAEGAGWGELLKTLKEEASLGGAFEGVERVAAIIWEGEREFFHTVCETSRGESSGGEGGRGLGCLLTREGEVREALRSGKAAVRELSGGEVEALLPIRQDSEFLGIFYLLGKEEDSGRLEAGLAELQDCFQSAGIELIRRHRLERELRGYQEETRYFRDRERQQYLFKDLVCESEAMGRVYEELSERAEDEDPLWLTGEAGTGKELLARALHHLGGQQEGMLIRMACAKFPEELVDIELFGCAVSELTGAVAPRKGIFELAEKGTIFLDEIDCLDLSIQGKLVRLMKEREVRRIGDAVGRPVAVRMIASSHRDLEKLCGEGRFRRDLYELLRPHRLEVPALRERREDVIPLAELFLEKFAERYEARCRRMSGELEAWLKQYSWPGNVRQLQTFMEAAVLMSEDKEVIEGVDLILE